MRILQNLGIRKSVRALAIIAAAVAPALWFAPPVSGAGFDEGWRAYQQGNFAVALREWSALANAGNSRAQFNLGVLFDEGRGVEESRGTAIDWWQKAAGNGHKQAQHNLGLAYLFGRGVAKDFDKAVGYFKQASTRGLARSQYNLGKMYAVGFGVEQNQSEAFKCSVYQVKNVKHFSLHILLEPTGSPSPRA